MMLGNRMKLSAFADKEVFKVDSTLGELAEFMKRKVVKEIVRILVLPDKTIEIWYIS